MDQLRNFLEFEWLVIGEYRLQILDLLWLALIWLSTWLLMRLIKGLLKRRNFRGRIALNDEQRRAFRRLGRFLLYPLATILTLEVLGVDISRLLLYDLYHPDKAKGVKTIHILGIIAIAIAARGLLWYLNRWFVTGNKAQALPMDQGRRLAIFQIIKYVVVLLVILFCLTLLQVNLSIFWVGTTGLLLVVGLALQQTFNDFFSGLLILLDGTMEVGDMILVDSLQLTGEVKEIRLRTTVVETLDSTNVIVPNSAITSSNVVNWTYNDEETRFRLHFKVAYGSNVQQVRKVVRSCAISHGLVLKSPEPRVRFTEFGDSGLHFELLFWLEQTRSYEDVLSDLRFKIEAEFRRNEIRIPFPQRDLHIRSDFRMDPPPLSPEAEQAPEKKEESSTP